MQPDLADCPAWVRWVAQDATGTWWGFEAEPNEGHAFWYENEVGRCLKLGEDQPNPGWRDSLNRLSSD